MTILTVSFMPAFAQYETYIDDSLFIFVQTTLRNSDGHLVTYLESTTFTDLNLSAMDSFLDHEASRGNVSVINIDDSTYQVIRLRQSISFDSHTVVASTNLFDSINGKHVSLVRFTHDGYPVIPDDTLESNWTFLRKIG